MQYKTNQSFTNLLQHVPELRNFLAKLSDLEQINQILASKLDSNLFSNCKVSNLRDGILILSTTSPAWNHKLRFHALDILSTLRSDPRWSGLKSIEVRVDYLTQSEAQYATDPKELKPISMSNAALIKQTASNIDCPALAAALKKLAAHSSGG